MITRLQQARRSDKGFTLIELLIVIVILGVLAGIVVFSVSGISDRGKTSACQSTVKTIQVAGEAYYAKNGNYAPDMATLARTGFIQAPAPAVTDITYTVTAGPPPALAVTAGTTGVCAP